jgi:hypothetical protein
MVILQPPRLIFVVSQMDESSHFFLGYFSRNGRRVTLINPPPHIDVTIGAQLKAVLPRKIGSDRVVDDTMRVIELKGAGFGGRPFISQPMPRILVFAICVKDLRPSNRS